jgi:hypothetical protein
MKERARGRQKNREMGAVHLFFFSSFIISKRRKKNEGGEKWVFCASLLLLHQIEERESKRTKREMSIVHLFFFSFMIDINEKKKEQKRKKTFSYFGSAMNLAQAHDEPCSKIHVSILTVGFVNSHRHHFLKKCGRILHATNKLAMLFNLKPHSPSSRPPNWV